MLQKTPVKYDPEQFEDSLDERPRANKRFRVGVGVGLALMVTPIVAGFWPSTTCRLLELWPTVVRRTTTWPTTRTRPARGTGVTCVSSSVELSSVAWPVGSPVRKASCPE
jgi:hypothetical protein